MKLLVMVLILLAATLFDLKTRKIPNYLNFGAAMIGIIINTLPGSPGLLFSLKGLVIGLVLLILPWLVGIIGAGDVKLFGVVGSFFGANIVAGTATWFAVIVLIVFLITSIRNKSLINNLSLTKSYLITSLLTQKANLVTKAKDSHLIPYAPFISFAVLLQFTLPFRGGWF